MVEKNEEPPSQFLIPPWPVLVVAEGVMKQNESLSRFHRPLHSESLVFRPIRLIIQHQYVIAGARTSTAGLPWIIRRLEQFGSTSKYASTAGRDNRSRLRRN